MTKRELVTSDNIPQPGAALSIATIAGDLIFTSGQVGIDLQSGKTAEGFSAQLRQSLENLVTLLEAAGSDAEHVLKTTCFLADISNFREFDTTYAEFFPSPAPARSTVEAPLVNGLLFEIEAIAVKK